MAKKFIIKGAFGIDNLTLVNAEIPTPGPFQVTVKMKAASLNYRDLLVTQGLYDPKQKPGLVPLSDGVGVVHELGAGVTRLQKGDRVCTTFFQRWIKGTPTLDEMRSTLGSPIDGALCEYMLLDSEGLVRAPKHLTDEEAATLPCAALTAWTALVTEGGIKAGDTILTQGTGGVSTFALQFAELFGARVIATSGSEEKIEKLKELGAYRTINYKQQAEWGKLAKSITDEIGVDHVIEVGGADTLEQSFKAVRPKGRISIIGVLSGLSTPVNLRYFISGALTVQGIFVGHRDSFEAMNRAIEHNAMRPVIDRVFSFDQAPDAMRYMQSQKHFGKVCIRIS
ncbi:MAG: NAD(P)-dependent alcohol dehydrogenase [Deltaproteobacteria bacterium]|nr:NAD(P)-dependent alcohol dehydrogenase [Deltaproteobacteria bacterium]